MSHPCVEVEQVSLSFSGRPALQDLSWQAMSGQVTAVLGPNGAGKTTTMLICEGLLRPDRGRVRVLGLDPHQHGPALRPRVGVMIQDGGLPVMARARTLLDHLARLYAHPRDTDRLAQLLGIEEFARTPVRRLSVGQRQRLALALALVGRPELVFLDEPTAGLDAHGREVVWDLIRGLRAAGTSVVLNTHVMEEAETLADRVIIIDRGRLVAAGSPGELTAGSTGTGEVTLTGTIGPEALAALRGVAADHELHISTRSGRGLREVFLELTSQEEP